MSTKEVSKLYRHLLEENFLGSEHTCAGTPFGNAIGLQRMMKCDENYTTVLTCNRVSSSIISI
jgi:hypothetical protein